jgi:very-short-patch-repair endonuclease
MLRNWSRSANGNLTRTYNGVSYTVFRDRSGTGWRYAGGRKFSEKLYPTERAAMKGAEGSGANRLRPKDAGPGAAQKDIKRWARKMRQEMTGAEAILWARLRELHPRWSPQRRILGRIADFYCNEALLVVEVDGEYHSTAEQRRKDAFRDGFLKAHGVEVLRFTNAQVEQRLDQVVLEIMSRVWLRASGKFPLPISPGPRYKPAPRARSKEPSRGAALA